MQDFLWICFIHNQCEYVRDIGVLERAKNMEGFVYICNLGLHR